MANTVYRHIRGMDQVGAFLKQLPKDLATKLLASAVNAGADILVPVAKQYARRSVRTGALYASIGKKVVNYPTTPAAVAVVGPRRGYFRKGGVKVGDGESRSGAESPSHYAHLVEFGHIQKAHGGTIRAGNAKAVGAGKMTFVAPRPFMRPAYHQTLGAVNRAMVEGLRRGIEQTRKKMIKQGAHAA